MIMTAKKRFDKMLTVWEALSKIPDEIWDLYISNLDSCKRKANSLNDAETYISLYLKKENLLDKKYKIKESDDIHCGGPHGCKNCLITNFLITENDEEYNICYFMVKAFENSDKEKIRKYYIKLKDYAKRL